MFIPILIHAIGPAMYLSQYDWSEFDCDTYSIDEQWFDKDGKWLTFNYAGANLAGLGGD